MGTPYGMNGTIPGEWSGGNCFHCLGLMVIVANLSENVYMVTKPPMHITLLLTLYMSSLRKRVEDLSSRCRIVSFPKQN